MRRNMKNEMTEDEKKYAAKNKSANEICIQLYFNTNINFLLWCLVRKLADA